ncbi:hypothetical protein, partial [Nannocystis exedens]|uniref:hypothetical protein n=1 Tax=Nannocystis exedens TaxID=54 RepID=UPI001C4313EB
RSPVARTSSLLAATPQTRARLSRNIQPRTTRPEAGGDVVLVLVLVGLGLRLAVGGEVGDAVEAERDLAGLVVLPPHLAAVAQVGEVVVVALVVEDVEAGQGLVDRPEVAEVAPEVGGDQIVT